MIHMIYEMGHELFDKMGNAANAYDI